MAARPDKTEAKNRAPTFYRYGGTHHLHIENAEDMRHVLDLAPGKWMATSCPVSNLRLNRDFLQALDTNRSGRILCEEVRGSVKWLFKLLKPSVTWIRGEAAVPIDLFREDEPDAASMKELALKVLEDAGVASKEKLALDDVRRKTAEVVTAKTSADGIIPLESIENQETAGFAADLLKAYGSDILVEGGVCEEHIQRFQVEARQLLEWYRQNTGELSSALLPFGSKTAELYRLFDDVREKVDQYFAVCRLLRYDPSLQGNLQAQLQTMLAEKNLVQEVEIADFLRQAPLSKPDPQGKLQLDRIENQFYSKRIDTLKEQLLIPHWKIQTGILSEEDWLAVKDSFRAYDSWQKSRPSVPIDFLSPEKIEAYLAASHGRVIQEMIQREKSYSNMLDRLRQLERLLLFHQFLFLFLNNFVSFPYLFRTDSRAIFEMGSLVMEGREFTFSIRVENREAHSALAKNSGIYLLYILLSGPAPEDNFEIAVPITSGNARGFYIGKRGVFYTWDGRELDAQIVKIVENPISLWESMRQPFRRLADLITSRVTQLTSTLQKEAEAGIQGAQSTTQQLQADLQQVKQSTAADAPPTRSARDTMIGAGFLVAGLGTAVKFLVDAAKQLTQPETLRVLLFMIGLFLLITLLINSVTAARRLRRRDLSVLLQASGWALNGKMRLIPSMAQLFSRKASFPRNSRRRRQKLVWKLKRQP